MYVLFHYLKGSSFQAQAVDDDGKLSLLTLWEQVCMIWTHTWLFSPWSLQ